MRNGVFDFHTSIQQRQKFLVPCSLLRVPCSLVITTIFNANLLR
ncbi:MAG: hypothetical protein ACLBM4_02835 [Dolichospermum sp.]